ncbi:hypothetical protein GLYMA_20G185966v4 [Glycine max]|nr:hypothetical protein GLYMA_20G185966v4 [Glycine max]KAH1036811.1 hypothetical protein GYH30_056302 [Glycine max]
MVKGNTLTLKMLICAWLLSRTQVQLRLVSALVMKIYYS